jgi:UDP-glucose 4-epimerase
VKETAPDPLAKFRDVNTEGTLALAEQAYHLGVKRFVFVSSIKVNGEITKPGNPFSTQDIPAPVSHYGISKMEAEKGLMVLSAKTGMEIVIIRPPLVYGPGVKGNFAHMVYWLKKGTPLPFGAIHNQRSFVALDNLVDLLVTCIDHPAAANEIFFVSDDEDVSTTELLHRLGRAIGCPARLIPIPEKLLQAAATLFGRQDIATRLCGSLQVDIEKTKNLLDWTPPLTLDAGLRKIHSETIV